ncbi:MAG: methyltransferase, partial [Planctomycetes bacterium]|nr:methyltransferase [Planctomycetota bacterium]
KNISQAGHHDKSSVQWSAAGEKINGNAESDTDSDAEVSDDYDLVLLNPPAHSGKDQDLSLARIMFQQAWKKLSVGGRLFLVANRQLPYEKDLRSLDQNMQLIKETGIFKVYLLEKKT